MSLVDKTAVVTPAQAWAADVFTFLIRPVRIFQDYQLENLRPDLIAGITVAVVMLPQAIAYALIAELPPETGIYAAVVASIVGALWGSSNHLHTGPTNAASLLVLATLLPIVVPGTTEYVIAAGLLAVMVGVIRLVMGMAKLGVLVNFVSDSVIIGFTAGAGILISVNQIRALFKLPIESSPGFFPTVGAIFNNLPQAHLASLVIGLGTVFLIIALKRLSPRLPAPLISMVVASAIVWAFNLDEQGVIVLGELPRSLPPFTPLPVFDVDLISQMTGGALAIAAIGLVEAMSIARAIAAYSGQRLDSNQEFVGQGLSNVAAGFFSGYTCSGSFTRSAVNFSGGGKTPIAVVFSGLFVLMALFLFAPFAAYLPRAALAGVIIVTAYGMVDRREMKRIWHASRGDSAIMIATIAATLLLPLQFAVLAGIVVSIVRFLIKTSMPQVYPVIPDENFQHFVHQETHSACPQLGLITISGPLYFGAVQHVETAIRGNMEENPGQRFLLLRMHLVDHCDVSGIHMLEAVVRLYRQRNGDVFIAGLHPPIRKQMELSGFDRLLGENHFVDRNEAVSYLFHRVLEPSICIYECPVRVFAECQALPKWSYGAVPDAAILPEHALESWLPSELKERMHKACRDNDILLIDVREPREYQKGHIPDAELLPMRFIPEKGQTLPTNCPIVVVCRIGRRSRLAANMLKNMGYTQVYNLQGGVLAWEAAGYPLSVE